MRDTEGERKREGEERVGERKSESRREREGEKQGYSIILKRSLLLLFSPT